MKSAVIFLGLLVAVVTADENCPLAQALNKGFELCKETLNPSEEVLQLVAQDKGENNRDVSCFQACMASKAGLMNDAKFDIEKMESLLRSAENPNDEIITSMVEMMKSCRDEAETSDDECDVAANYMKCTAAKRAAA